MLSYCSMLSYCTQQLAVYRAYGWQRHSHVSSSTKSGKTNWTATNLNSFLSRAIIKLKYAIEMLPPSGSSNIQEQAPTPTETRHDVAAHPSHQHAICGAPRSNVVDARGLAVFSPSASAAMSTLKLLAVSAPTLWIAYAVYKRIVHVRYLSALPGPPTVSYIWGDTFDLKQAPVGTRWNVWRQRYGPTYLIREPFMVNQNLMVPCRLA